MTKHLHALLHEPLVHFLALGTLLFACFQWAGGATGPRPGRIVITRGQIDNLAVGFARTWQRPPTEQELKALVDDSVREEIAVREAMAVGLDGGDTVIRRRLRQKLELVAEDVSAATPPTDGELEAWLEGHPDQFRIEARVSFRHVFLNRDRRGAATEEDARRLLVRLRRGGSSVNHESLGDPLLLPPAFDSFPQSEVAKLFGAAFASRLMEVDPGGWTGPIDSAYGLHLVLVRERNPARLPELAAVRAVVERELLNDRRKKHLDGIYDRLLQKYSVVVEKRDEAR